eukprot:TRINITY_DN668_c0_g1_i1.p1 TRINITY_DN668_c0_g1~~TRINITY_DN668_c0_g1_i1.p1  ORF type:complete len:555 (+),score=73.65 TRINITY_DN668_c0_g1_i1:154-1665(+)
MVQLEKAELVDVVQIEGGAETACMRKGIVFSPPLPGTAFGLVAVGRGADACQELCVSTPGCFRFSYRGRNSTCSVHGMDATWSEDAGVISGPPRCVADVTLRFQGIDYNSLSEQQKAFISKRLPRDLATSLGVPISAVHDMHGNPGQVALSAGSLVAHGSVVVHAGSTIKVTAARLGKPQTLQLLADTVVEAQATAGATATTLLATQAISVKLATFVEEECVVEGVRLFPAMPGQVASVASTHQQCREFCAATQGCGFVTFQRSTGSCVLGDSERGMVTIKREPNATAGPRVCVHLPSRFPEPSEADIEGKVQEEIVFDTVLRLIKQYPEWSAILGLTLCILPCGVLAGVLCFLRRRRKWRRRGPNASGTGTSRELEYHPVATDNGLASAAEDDEKPNQPRLRVSQNAGATAPASRGLGTGPQGSPWHMPTFAQEHASEVDPAGKLTTSSYAASQNMGQPGTGSAASSSSHARFLTPEDTYHHQAVPPSQAQNGLHWHGTGAG